MTSPVRVVAFASGGGTNFQALLDHTSEDRAWEVVGLVTNRAEAGALERARSRGVDTVVIPTKDRDPDAVAADMLDWLDARDADLICLAGYMRLIPAPVVERYRRRILNVHPALLPAFGGKGMYGINVHNAVLESGARISGATIHYVDEEYDRGTILAQWPVPVMPGDTREKLAARVLEAEHALYPAAVDHVARALIAGEEAGPMPWPSERFEIS